MKLVAVFATLLYVVDTLQVENKTAKHSSPDNSYVPFISKKTMRVKRLRGQGTPDKDDPVDELMLEQGGKKKRIHHVHTTDSSAAAYKTTEEPEDPEDLQDHKSGNPVCVYLHKKCFAACEHKRDLCEKWRSLAEY